MALSHAHLIKFISGPTKDILDKLSSEFVLYGEKKDQYFFNWFIATLFEKMVLTVYGLDTSQHVWSALANITI